MMYIKKYLDLFRSKSSLYHLLSHISLTIELEQYIIDHELKVTQFTTDQTLLIQSIHWKNISSIKHQIILPIYYRILSMIQNDKLIIDNNNDLIILKHILKHYNTIKIGDNNFYNLYLSYVIRQLHQYHLKDKTKHYYDQISYLLDILVLIDLNQCFINENKLQNFLKILDHIITMELEMIIDSHETLILSIFNFISICSTISSTISLESIHFIKSIYYKGFNTYTTPYNHHHITTKNDNLYFYMTLQSFYYTSCIATTSYTKYLIDFIPKQFKKEVFMFIKSQQV